MILVITNETKSSINRMFGLAIKENVFSYLLALLASNSFENRVKIKQNLNILNIIKVF